MTYILFLRNEYINYREGGHFRILRTQERNAKDRKRKPKKPISNCFLRPNLLIEIYF